MKPLLLCLASTIAPLIFGATNVAAQTYLGTVELMIGAPREQVLSNLRTAYRVDSASGKSDQWIIMNSDGPPYHAIGTVTFGDGRLATVSRDWSPRPTETSQVEAIRAVVGALKALHSGSEGACLLEDTSNRGPGFELSGIDVRCGLRRVSLTVVRYQGTESFTITEFIGSDGR